MFHISCCVCHILTLSTLSGLRGFIRYDIIKNINGTVLDKDGNIIATLSGAENRKIVSTEDMPEYLPKAFIAIEDKRFYEHKGIDIKRTTYATIMYIIHHGDSASGGGSTITQQLIKNIKNDKADSGSKGIERKIREMARAYNVEKILSKDQILKSDSNGFYNIWCWNGSRILF